MEEIIKSQSKKKLDSMTEGMNDCHIMKLFHQHDEQKKLLGLSAGTVEWRDKKMVAAANKKKEAEKKEDFRIHDFFLPNSKLQL